VATSAAMEELLPARPEPGHDVLEVGHRGGRAAEHRGVERAADGGEHPERHEAASDLEAAVGDVLVRHPVAGDMQRRPEQKCERARACARAQRGAGRHVQRDDHLVIFAPPAVRVYAPRDMSWLKRLFSSTPTTPAGTDKAPGEQDIVRDDGEEDVREMENLSGGAGVGGVAAPEAAETVEAELSEYEKPTDLAP
jgi:hypothetical protein